MEQPGGLKAQMNAQCLVELGHEAGGQLADTFANTLNGNGSDLLGLGFGVVPQAGEVSRQQDLERVDPLSAGGNRHDGDYPAAKAGRGAVSSVVTNDHCRASLAGFLAAGRVESDSNDFPTTHLTPQAISNYCIPCLGVSGVGP